MHGVADGLPASAALRTAKSQEHRLGPRRYLTRTSYGFYVEAIAIRLEAIAISVEATAIMLWAIASSVEAI